MTAADRMPKEFRRRSDVKSGLESRSTISRASSRLGTDCTVSRVAYVYLPAISRTEAGELLRSLEGHGFQVTRIGKNDPPKKRRVTLEEAVDLILSSDGKSVTNCTFIEDDATNISVSFEIRTDVRWGFSSVSISYPESIPSKVLCGEIFRRTRPFACVSRRVSGGKEQTWDIRLIGDDCPEFIRAKLQVP